MKQKTILVSIVLGAVLNSLAQDSASNILKFKEGMISPKATLEDLS